MPLACDTIDRLTHLVFAAGSIDLAAPAPTWVAATIDDLLCSDESFQRWASRSQITHPPGTPLGNILVQLASDTSWMSTGAETATISDCALPVVDESRGDDLALPSRPTRQVGRADGEQRLWEAAQMALRLDTLQSRFAAALEYAKREAIYQLAYGLSHEINNPLANIAARARVLAEDERDPQRRQMLAAIVDQAMRGCEMIADLMLVARPPQLTLVELDIDKLLHEIVEQSRPWAARQSVSLSVERAATAGLIQGDAAALREAVWCVLRNSLEAVAEGGRIEVRCITHCASETLGVEIQDDGPGLSSEALKNCFDPYYSGREAGRGLGLGLAKAERIIALHRGKIRMTNCATGGCIACIELPTISNKDRARGRVPTRKEGDHE